MKAHKQFRIQTKVSL